MTTLNDFHSEMDVDGQNGYDIVTLDDSAEAAASTITVTDNQVLGDGTYFGSDGELTYDRLEELFVNAGQNGDSFLVTSTDSDTKTTVGTGGGVDLFTVESAGTVDLIRSELVVDGQAAGGSLSLIDSADLTGDEVSITATQIGLTSDKPHYFGNSTATVTYLNLNHVNLGTGLDGDSIYIQSTVPGTGMTIAGGGGNDNFRVDSNGDSTGGVTDLISSQVNLVGGLGINTLVLEDTDGATSDTVSLAPDPLAPLNGQIGKGATDTFFPMGGSISYQDISLVGLLTSDLRADVVNVTPAAAPIPLGTGFVIDGQSAMVPGGPNRDRLNFDLSLVLDPQLTVTDLGSADLTSSTHATVRYATTTSSWSTNPAALIRLT